MAEIVMIMGESGSGKSASLRNFQPGEICILNVAGKRLPFRNSFGQSVVDVNQLPSTGARYQAILNIVRSGKYKAYAIDDSQYLLAFEAFDRALEAGYSKFTEMAQHFYDLTTECRKAKTRWERDKASGIWMDTKEPLEDTIIYFLHHTDKTDDGIIRPKTQGRMLDEKLNVAGLFTMVLMAETDGKEYTFRTHSDGSSVVKTPMEMFSEDKIPNDLKLVDTTIREYYGMK